MIDRIRSRAPARADVVLGIGDDAAVLQLPAGRQLVVCTDALNAGVHFPHDTAATDIGWKALAVNLSDLAAMGAEPAWCTLSLSLPDPGEAWLDGFLDGFLELAALHRVSLVGGDTTCGPLAVGVTVHGFVEPGRALLRSGARPGEDIWVSGTLGDAAGALALLGHADLAPAEEGAAPAPGAAEGDPAGILATLRPRLDRPTPRVALGRTLQGTASAALDLSDGLLADLGHLCRASGVGAEVALDALPASEALHAAFAAQQRHLLQATGGDDYELCFTAPPAMAERIGAAGSAAGVALTRIGRTIPGSTATAFTVDGRQWQPPRSGYMHFAG
nr:thiamine-phosphate kinase [Lysobacter sp. GX 14042]